MKEILFNYDNLTKEDIDEVVIRTKALIINHQNEIILGYSHQTFQFPGGHLQEGETLEECLFREIKEETGIEFKDVKVKPFLKTTYYNKNYRQSEKNRQNEIYYFIIESEATYNINNTNFDEFEKEGNFTLKRIPLDNVEQILIDSIPDNPINKIITEEMLEAIKEYRKIKEITNIKKR